MAVDLLYEVSQIQRRLANCIREGRIHAVQYDPPRVKVEYDKDDNGKPVHTCWLRYFEERAGHVIKWNPPKVGESCMLFSPGGDLRLGVAVLGLNNMVNPAADVNPNVHKYLFDDGTNFSYDRFLHHLAINLLAGTAEINGDTLTLNIDIVHNGDYLHNGNMVQFGDTDRTGALTVSSNITSMATVTGETVTDATGTMQAIRTIYNGHRHNLNDPTPDKQMR
ncbi:phage baseplate assembly protein V [Vibrio coralliilyticus]|uniref:phage baseplate assembly protein V n=1 Tax=Vibrio coralliilyticus TaxID=190893 RepID=UPI00068AFED2|nr:phage baseplate assembly protein V [Vibrio coralliilyticus]NOH41715.1 phage baseplate assembly protein V [Vibrio coralliilyticus]